MNSHYFDHKNREILKYLQENNSESIEYKKCTFTLYLNPHYMNNIKKGVLDELNSMLIKYNKRFGGIVMAYDTVQVVSQQGWTFHSNPAIHIKINANLYVFKPEVDTQLQGVVIKKSFGHIGCHIHQLFNVTVKRSEDLSYKSWLGSHVQLGDTVALNVTAVNLAATIPTIMADITDFISSVIPETEKKKSSNSQEDNSLDTSKIVTDIPDGGTSSLLTPKKKKRKKEFVTEENDVNMNKKKNESYEDVEEEESERLLYDEFNNSDKIIKQEQGEEFLKQKKKMKKRDKIIEENKSDNNLVTSINNNRLKHEIMSDVDSPRRKKHKNAQDDEANRVSDERSSKKRKRTTTKDEDYYLNGEINNEINESADIPTARRKRRKVKEEVESTEEQKEYSRDSVEWQVAKEAKYKSKKKKK